MSWRSMTLALILMAVVTWKLLWRTLLWSCLKPTTTQLSGALLCAEAPSTFVKMM